MLGNLEQLSQVFDDRDSRILLSEATDSVLSDNFYRALRALRDLLPREARLLAVGR